MRLPDAVGRPGPFGSELESPPVESSLDPEPVDTEASGRTNGGCDGVGSNSIHPYWGKYTSTQACASCSFTTYALLAES